MARRSNRFLVLALAVSAAVEPALAQRTGVEAEAADAARYETCMANIERDAERAFDAAVEWRGLGGGVAAEHCVAASLMALEYFEQAAARLEDLAQRPAVEGALKADLLAQAAEGWLLAGAPERAYAVLTAAIGLDPERGGLWADRGRAHADMGIYDRAVDDLSRAIHLAPGNPEYWGLRGSAHRFADDHAAAMTDLNEALRIDPDHLPARLERGNLRRVMGDDGGARRDWIEIIARGPKSEPAASARANLERLDVEAEAAE